ncbi:MAG: hypothetical protein ACRDOI_13130 [Trebonia sp.]
MALRDKLAQRAAPFLEPGEQIQSIFLAQSGASPYWSFLSAWIVVITAGYATVAVTDRAVVVLRNGRFTGTRPKSLLARLPRQPLDHPSGLWGKVHLNGTRYWVHKRFHKDVEAGNAAIAAAGTPAV